VEKDYDAKRPREDYDYALHPHTARHPRPPGHLAAPARSLAVMDAHALGLLSHIRKLYGSD
jgi:hypothetical protein